MKTAIAPFNLYWAEAALKRPFRPITPREAGVLVQRFLVLASAATFLLVATLGVIFGRLMVRVPPAHLPMVLVAAGQAVREVPKVVPTVTFREDPKPIKAPATVVSESAKVVTVVAQGKSAKADKPEKPAKTERGPRRDEPAATNIFGTMLNDKGQAPDLDAPVVAPKKARAAREDSPVAESVVVEAKPIDRLPASKSGVASISAGSLTLQSGRQVKVGGQLPSGEDLLSIDVKRNRIETSARVIVVIPDNDEKQ